MIVLRHLLEYTPGEIAELLDLPRGTVNSRLRRGLDALEGDECEARARADRGPGRARGARAGLGDRAGGVRGARAERAAPVLEPIVRSRSRPSSPPALLSPPGRAVLDEIREVVGVERAQPALFSLPAPGRLLVTADSGAWVVAAGRLEAPSRAYREASWSPFGRFVVAARRERARGAQPDGTVRWSLARPDVRLPRWGGTRTDTRIAYFSGGQLRVVGGDGEGDRLLDEDAAARLPHGEEGGHRLAYAARDGTVRVVDADTGDVVDRDAAVSLLEPQAAIVSPIAAGRSLAGPMRISSSSRDSAGPSNSRRLEPLRPVRSRWFPTIEGWCCAR